MRFNLKAALENLLGRKPERHETEGPLSVVMLLRESKVSSLDRLRKAGEQAFGVPFSDDRESQYFVVQKVIFTVIKVGMHTLSWTHFAKPYLQEEESKRFVAQMPLASQRDAWGQHSAWEAIDYVKSRAQPEVEYAVIARICLQLLDSNCIGVFLPRERVFVPNDGSASEFLRSLVRSHSLA